MAKLYRNVIRVELLKPFQCRALDTFEGVLTGDCRASRRYADAGDLQVSLQLSDLQLLVIGRL